jgi:hypothetical protein
MTKSTIMVLCLILAIISPQTKPMWSFPHPTRHIANSRDPMIVQRMHSSTLGMIHLLTLVSRKWAHQGSHRESDTCINVPYMIVHSLDLRTSHMYNNCSIKGGQPNLPMQRSDKAPPSSYQVGTLRFAGSRASKTSTSIEFRVRNR